MRNAAHRAGGVEFGEMEGERRMDGDETGDLAAFLEGLDHFGQGGVAEAVAVVGEEDLFAFDEVPHRDEPLADIAPDAGVDQRDAPFGRLFAEDFDFLAISGNNAVAIGGLLRLEEIFLDHIGLEAEAEHEIMVPVLAVIFHDMHQDRLASDRDHRLWGHSRNIPGYACRARRKIKRPS